MKDYYFFRACANMPENMPIDERNEMIAARQDRLTDVIAEYNAAHKPIDGALMQCHKCGRDKMQEAADKLFLSLV